MIFTSFPLVILALSIAISLDSTGMLINADTKPGMQNDKADGDRIDIGIQCGADFHISSIFSCPQNQRVDVQRDALWD